MVKYLNNRKQKSKANREQNTGSTQASSSLGQKGPAPKPGANGGGQGQNNTTNPSGQGQAPQNQPLQAFLGRLGAMIKGVLTFKPTPLDDTFSLGERRTQAQPPGQKPNPNPSALQSASAGSQGSGGRAQGQAAKAQPEPGQGQGKNQGQNQSQSQSQGQDQPTANPDQKAAGTPGAGTQAQSGAAAIAPPEGTAPYFQQNPQVAGGVTDEVHHTQQGGTPAGEEEVPIEQQVHYSLKKNLAHIKRVFNLPANKGFTVREFLIGFEPPCPAFILFTEGLADKTIIDNFVLEPLMVLSSLERYAQQDPLTLVTERLITTNQVENNRNFIKIAESILMGSTALFVEGSNSCLLVETKGWEHRAVGRPSVENVVRGPQEAFNEVLISNVALVRSRLRTQNLMSEMVKVGRLSKSDVAIMYLRDIANPALVGEVHKRLNSLGEIDYIPDTGMLEQLIEDNAFVPMTQTLSTERPDRVAAYLAEGHVAILMSSTPFALIVPVTFWGLLQSAEDYYVRWPYGSLMRMVRVTALLIAMLMPALYIAIVNYHQSMIPTALLYAVAAAREQVPFPAVLELVIMDLAFELIREAGIRIPSVIGTTIGIVGALILGQAAVQANLITPLVIIIVALTGLSSFAIPNYNLSFQVRIMRFIYLAAASVGGFFTLACLMVVHMAVLSVSNSFGVPVLSPATPNRPSKDTVLRGPIWAMENRPPSLRSLKGKRQPPEARSWDPNASGGQGEKNG